MVVRSSYPLLVNTVPHGGQIIVPSTSQHRITRRSDHRAFHQSTQNHTAIRSSCIPPVNTVPYGSQIIVHSTSQHSTTWWSDHRAFHQSTQYHMVVRSSCISPVNTVPHGVRSPCISPVNTVQHGAQIIVHHTSQHSTTWWSDHRASHQSTQYHVVVR